MKVSLSLDKNSIKQFFIEHGEKIVFGLAGICIVYFLYSAIQVETFDKTPEDVAAKIAVASENIEKTPWQPEQHNIEPSTFQATAVTANVPIDGGHFAMRTPLFRDTNIDVGIKRGEPAFLTVRELMAASGAGPFAFENDDPLARLNAGAGQPNIVDPGRGAPVPGGHPRGVALPGEEGGRGAGGGIRGLLEGGGEGDLGGEGDPDGGGEAQDPDNSEPLEPQGVVAPANSKVEGRQWVVVTGLIPYKEQMQKFVEVFEDARFKVPEKDYPQWLGFFVQRAEITPANEQDVSKLSWTSVGPNRAPTPVDLKWAVAAPEVVDPTLTHPNLTYPLGPLLEKNWGKEVAHPKIPMLAVQQVGFGEEPGFNPEEPEVNEPALPAGDPTDPFGPPRAAGAAGDGGEGTFGEGGRGAPGGHGLPGRFAAPGGRGFEGEGGFGGDPQMQAAQEPDFLLFRFFDFTVQEGKRYRYRVQLGLANPNFEVRTDQLEDPALAKVSYRRTDWSEPTPPVTVSSYSYMLAGPVTPSRGILESSANVINVQFEQALGAKAVYECRDKESPKERERKVFSVQRGKVIHYSTEVDVRNPLTKMVETKNVEFDSDTLMVDMTGGQLMRGVDRIRVPGEILVMDPGGWLSVKSELEDEPEYRREVGWLTRAKDARESAGQVPGGEGFAPGEDGGLRGRGRGRGPDS